MRAHQFTVFILGAFAGLCERSFRLSARLNRGDMMDAKKVSKAAAPRNLGGYLAGLAKMHEHGGGHAMGSVRTATHHGHTISVETMYVITIDGKKARISLMVGDDGQVHCHALPNYQFGSALDMVKVVIDQFPDDFPIKPQASGKRKKAAASMRGMTPKRRK